jgi:hypothetical protein
LLWCSLPRVQGTGFRLNFVFRIQDFELNVLPLMGEPARF